jgi:hypothetical protein
MRFQTLSSNSIINNLSLVLCNITGSFLDLENSLRTKRNSRSRKGNRYRRARLRRRCNFNWLIHCKETLVQRKERKGKEGGYFYSNYLPLLHQLAPALPRQFDLAQVLARPQSLDHVVRTLHFLQLSLARPLQTQQLDHNPY